MLCVAPIIIIAKFFNNRDFVSARKAVFTRGSYYIACMSIVTELKPEESGKVRFVKSNVYIYSSFRSHV